MRSVEVREETVIKHDAPDLMRIEVEKTRRGHEIGRSTGLFYAPRVLEYDETAGRATFERLHGLRMVREILAYAPTRDLACAIGRSLAAIHRYLELPVEMCNPIPQEFQETGNAGVFLHGDFNVENVLVMEGCGSVAVIDWQMTAVYDSRGTWGTPLFDVTWFINTLFCRPLHQYPRAAAEAPWAEFFLRSYCEAAEKPPGLDRVGAYMNHFFSIKMAQRRQQFSWARQIALIPANRRLWRFIRSLNL